jgi:hypothetical protein
MGNIKADRRRGHRAAGGAIGGIDVDRCSCLIDEGVGGRPCLQPRSLHAHRTFLWAGIKPDTAATKPGGGKGIKSLGLLGV